MQEPFHTSDDSHFLYCILPRSFLRWDQICKYYSRCKQTLVSSSNVLHFAIYFVLNTLGLESRSFQFWLFSDELMIHHLAPWQWESTQQVTKMQMKFKLFFPAHASLRLPTLNQVAKKKMPSHATMGKLSNLSKCQVTIPNKCEAQGLSLHILQIILMILYS